MDPRFGAGEKRLSLFQASPLYSSSAVRDGFLAVQALRADYIAPLDGVRRVEASPELISGIVRRELLKQRIREEIMAREMPDMRLLEAEVRRELEVERALVMGRFRGGTFPPVGDAPALAEARAPVASQSGLVFGVEKRMVGTRPVGEGPFYVNVFGERPVKNSALPQRDHENKRLASTTAHNVYTAKNEKVTSLQVKPTNAPGIKRKVDNLTGIAQTKAAAQPGSAEPDWSCALCQVSVSRREALDEHLRGRKHKSKQALMLGIHKQPGASKHLTSAKRTDPKKAQTKPQGKRVPTKETGLRPVKKQKTGTSLRCELCKVDCSSNKMLASHLGGKKHRARLNAAQRKAGATTVVAEKTAVGMGQSKKAEEEPKAAPEGAEDRTGMVDGPTLEEKGPAGAQVAVS